MLDPADPKLVYGCPDAEVKRRHAQCVGIVTMWAGHHRQQQGDVGRGPCHRAGERVVGEAVGHDFEGDPTERRLQTTDAGARGRRADGTAPIGADG